MKYKTSIVDKLTRMDDYYLNEWAFSIAMIFKREFNGRESVNVYLKTYEAKLHPPINWAYTRKGIFVAHTDVGTNRYNIADHLMYRLQYMLAKDYGIEFDKRPKNIWVKTSKRFNTQVRLTRLTLIIK